MKLLEILSENLNIPFKERCVVTIINNNGKSIKVKCEIPTTEEEQGVGLMYRDSLGENNGMLFYSTENGFWMKNVKIPLEMIFIKDGVIVDIQKAKPNDERTIIPKEESDYNLEVNDGFTKKNNISLGNKFYKS
jgi:uncharacterized membrane protein (UPF0127 family)